MSKPGAVKRRHVLVVGYMGEWNLKRAEIYRTPITGAIHGYFTLFKRAKDILGAKRKPGLRARRVRIVLEEL